MKLIKPLVALSLVALSLVALSLVSAQMQRIKKLENELAYQTSNANYWSETCTSDRVQANKERVQANEELSLLYTNGIKAIGEKWEADLKGAQDELVKARKELDQCSKDREKLIQQQSADVAKIRKELFARGVVSEQQSFLNTPKLLLHDIKNCDRKNTCQYMFNKFKTLQSGFEKHIAKTLQDVTAEAAK